MKKAAKIPRFYVSDISKIADLHPYSSFLEIFQKYLYQGLDELFLLDLSVLEITLDSTNFDDLEMLATTEDLQILKRISTTADSLGGYKSSGEASSSVRQIETIFSSIKSAARTTNNSELVAQVEILQEETKSKVRMRYGETCEESVLDKYHDQMGFPVEQRNTQSLRWAVPSDPEAYKLFLQTFSSSSSDHFSLDYDLVKSNLSQHMSKTSSNQNEISPTPAELSSNGISEVIVVDDINDNSNGCDSNGVSSSNSNSTHSNSNCVLVDINSDSNQNSVVEIPSDVAFYIVGRPDGLSTQLDMTHKDVHKWTTHTVVVEAKSRVRRISRPPPLYDQIQLTAYMLMTGSIVGDLVQSIRTESESTESSPKKARNNEILSVIEATHVNTTTVDLTEDECVTGTEEVVNNESAIVCPAATDKNQAVHVNISDISQYTSENFDVFRLDFRTDILSQRHGYHFFNDVFPRLHVFKDAVLTMRADDGLRYCWLNALSSRDEETLAEIIMNLCHYVNLRNQSS